MNNENEYEKQANDFLKSTETIFEAKFLKHDKHFEDDKDKRDIYEITLKRGDRKYVFKFGQSIAESGFKFINRNTKQETRYTWQDEMIAQSNQDIKKFKKLAIEKFGALGCYDIKNPISPNAYDVLACLTKNEVGSFEDFCADFGYDVDSRKAEKIYKAVCDEWNNVKMLWNDEEISQLQEIR